MNTLRRAFSFVIVLVLLSLNDQPAVWAAHAPTVSPAIQPIQQPGLSPVNLAAAQDVQIDCECDKTGAFVSPFKGVAPAIHADGSSPHNVYQLTTAGTGPINFTIQRIQGGSTVLTFSGQGGAWGFSPDDQRFVYWNLNGGLATVYLYNLETIPSKLVFYTSRSAAALQGLFSSTGAYFFLTTLTGTDFTRLQVIDSRTGGDRFATQFTFSIPPGEPGDTYGMELYGFSPDIADRTFVYAYVNGMNSEQWQVVNLKTGANSLVKNITAISAYWLFSKCGDRLALIEQNSPTQLTTALYNTQDLSVVTGSQQILTVGSTSLSTDADNHVATAGSTPHILGANTAANTCPTEPALDSVNLNPSTVIGGQTAFGFVKLSAPAPSGGALVSLSTSPQGLVGAGSVTVLAGATTQNFATWTNAVTEPTDVVITGTYNGASASATLHLVPPPPALAAITPDKTTVESGETLTLTVSLEEAAPEGGAVVGLWSTRTDILLLPPTVTILAGHTSATVSAVPQRPSSDTTVTLGASLGEISKTTDVLVKPRPARLESMSIDPTSLTGGNWAYGDIVLTDPVLTTTAITLSSSHPNVVSVLSTITLYQGSQQTEFSANTHGVAETVTATITATLNDSTRSVTLEVKPAELKEFAYTGNCEVALSDPSQKASVAGYPIQVTVRLDGAAPPNGAVVVLHSSRSDLIQVPATITITGKEAGLTLQTAEVTQPTPVTITASYRQKTMTLPVTLIPVPRYTVTRLPFRATGMNEDGQIAGEHFILQDGALTDVNQALDTSVYIRDINENGGLRFDATIEGVHGDYYYDGAQVQQIQPPDGYEFTTIYPRGLNDQGEVVGTACGHLPDYQCSAFEWKDGVSTALSMVPPRDHFTATDSNNSGTIVGYSVWEDPLYNYDYREALRWTGLSYDPFGWDQAISQAWVINNGGTVGLTFSRFIFDGYEGVYTWKDGELTERPMPTKTGYGQIVSINEQDDLLIWAPMHTGGESWPYFSFISNSIGTYLLGCAVDLEPGEHIGQAFDITGKGEILANAHLGAPSADAIVVLSPPGVEPPTLPAPDHRVYLPCLQK